MLVVLGDLRPLVFLLRAQLDRLLGSAVSTAAAEEPEGEADEAEGCYSADHSAGDCTYIGAVVVAIIAFIAIAIIAIAIIPIIPIAIAIIAIIIAVNTVVPVDPIRSCALLDIEDTSKRNSQHTVRINEECLDLIVFPVDRVHATVSKSAHCLYLSAPRCAPPTYPSAYHCLIMSGES